MRRGLFWTLVVAEIYALAGYPLFLWVLTRFRSQPIERRHCIPAMTVIIPAYNEGRVLARKLESVLAQDYPAERLEVLVASDGSTDDTNEIARRYQDSGVRLLELPRGGKAKSLNKAASEAHGEILVFTDANAILAPGALQALAANFADPRVGGVSADEKHEPDGKTDGAGLGERLYWEYDKYLKRLENQLGSIVSASGSMYAIRRDLFKPIQDAAATDDFSISTQVIRAGYRLVFEPSAVTWEPPVKSGEIEFRRKVRIVTRGLRSVYGVRDLLLPWKSGIYSLQLWSHKIVRRTSGFVALGILGLSASLAVRPLYRLLLVAQIAVYALATLGWLGQGRRWGRKPWFYVPFYFCLSNIAAMVGVAQFLRQRRLEVWEPRRDT